MTTSDRLDCMDLIQAWALYRDQGRWAELLDTFHPDGIISVTWFKGAFPDFVEASKRAAVRSTSLSKHQIGWPLVTLRGDRATAETSVTIHGRAALDGILVDNVSYGRFLDRLERRAGRWRLAERVAIYEKDRLDPVVPSEAFNRLMTQTDFSIYPEAYRFIAHRLVSTGRKLVSPIIVNASPEAEALYRRYGEWLTQA
ncbi:nuclear transport factor 2 family protein [Undibacter mobilis]|uniref:Nuclear transport factor 2 family protein n=1 Tax=Undibacter mobilis TaxID=2292256 RepID=A0A371BB96_9BRAD|nr:nuclear transport factor 2 family protein [Undibacter mobilis]RDV04673.1 nuclear transport factor 2 family protein [Undibacter mobilis]